jgi:hypothetical protein
VAESKVVAGSLFGSSVGLLLALWVPTWCIVIPLAASGLVRWELPIGMTIGLAVVTPIVHKNSALSVNDTGLTLVQFGKTVYIPWSNVESIKESAFGASLVFKDPQHIGLRQRRSFPFAGLDLFWHKRPTSVETRRQFDHYVPRSAPAA